MESIDFKEYASKLKNKCLGKHPDLIKIELQQTCKDYYGLFEYLNKRHLGRSERNGINDIDPVIEPFLMKIVGNTKEARINSEFEKQVLEILNNLISLKSTDQGRPKKTETKTDKLKKVLGKHGFHELSKVNDLPDSGKQSLIELISTNDLPYSIAMLERLPNGLALPIEL